MNINMKNGFGRKTGLAAVAVTLILTALPYSAADDPAVPEPEVPTLPIVTFHGVGIGLWTTDGSGILPAGIYEDTGYLTGTWNTLTGDVSLVFQGGLGTGGCSDSPGASGSGSIVSLAMGSETSPPCFADMDPNDLECHAYMAIFGENTGLNVSGLGVCTVAED